MKKFWHISILLLSIFITSCDNDVDTSYSGYKFPLVVGNTWKYIRTQTLSNISPAYAEITDTVFIDTIDVSVQDFYHPITGTKAIKLCHFNPDSSEGNCDFYTHNNMGLFCDHGGTTPDLNTMLLFPYRLEKHMNNSIMRGYKSTNEFAFQQTTLKYPFEIGTKWKTNTSGTLTKEVVGIENITVNGINSESYKIEYTYSEDSKATTIEYISDIGMIKRERYILDIELGSLHTLSIPLIATYSETWELLEYQVLSPDN